MGNVSVEAQAEVEHCGNIITEILLPRPKHVHMAQIHAEFVYNVADFIFKSVKIVITCVAYDDILREIPALEINIEVMIPEHRQFFVDEINKPSHIGYIICALTWNTYLQEMKNSEAKSLFLSSKKHQSYFFNIVHSK